MTCVTYTKKGTILHVAYIVFLTVIGGGVSYSAVYGATHIGSSDDRIALGFTIFFALLILSVDFFECRAIGARLYMNENGIGVSRFGRTKVFLPWNDIREIGLGSIPTPFGKKERVYFSNRKLNETERADLITLKYHTVHFSHIPKEWYGKMSERLPVPMPEEIRKKYVE